MRSLLALSKRSSSNVLGVEGADDHDAGERFAGHQVEPVDEALDALEARQGNDKYGDNEGEQNSHTQDR